MTLSTKLPRATVRLLAAILVTLTVLSSQFAPAGTAPTYRHVASWSVELSIDGDHEHGAAESATSLALAHGAASADSACSSDCPVKYVAFAYGNLPNEFPKVRIPSYVPELIGRPVAAGAEPPRA